MFIDAYSAKLILILRRFDGRTIRVDKASERGSGGGGGGFGGGRGGGGGGYVLSPSILYLESKLTLIQIWRWPWRVSFSCMLFYLHIQLTPRSYGGPREGGG